MSFRTHTPLGRGSPLRLSPSLLLLLLALTRQATALHRGPGLARGAIGGIVVAIIVVLLFGGFLLCCLASAFPGRRQRAQGVPMMPWRSGPFRTNTGYGQGAGYNLESGAGYNQGAGAGYNPSYVAGTSAGPYYPPSEPLPPPPYPGKEGVTRPQPQIPNGGFAPPPGPPPPPDAHVVGSDAYNGSGYNGSGQSGPERSRFGWFGSGNKAQ